MFTSLAARAAASIAAVLGLLLSVLAIPSSGAEPSGFEIVEFMAGLGIELPSDVAAELAAMSPDVQVEYLASLGADVEELIRNRNARPNPVAAEILRVVAPDMPRPEVADADAFHRKEQDLLIMGFIEELEQHFPDRLGYLRFAETNSGERQLVVPVADLTPKEADAVATVIGDGSIVVVPHAALASRAELSKLKAVLAKGITDGLGQQLNSWSIGINTTAGRVDINVSPQSEQGAEHAAGALAETSDLMLVEQLATKLAQSHLDSPQIQDGLGGRNTGLDKLLSVGVAAMEPPDADFRESAHIRGGEWILSDHGGVCTTNFLWIRSGSYRMGTAGHCSTTGGHSLDARAYRSFDHARLGGAANGDVGSVTLNGWTNDTRSDYALMTLPAAATGTSRVMTTSRTWRTVKATVAEEVVDGPWEWCHTGYGIFNNSGANKSCGTVTHADTSFTYNMNAGGQLTINGVYCIDALHHGGDSGGPVYYEHGDDAWAVGIHHGPGSTGDSCFTTIQAATNRHGYSIATS